MRERSVVLDRGPQSGTDWLCYMLSAPQPQVSPSLTPQHTRPLGTGHARALSGCPVSRKLVCPSHLLQVAAAFRRSAASLPKRTAAGSEVPVDRGDQTHPTTIAGLRRVKATTGEFQVGFRNLTCTPISIVVLQLRTQSRQPET